MKPWLPILLVALSAVAAVLVWTESRRAAIHAAQDFSAAHAARATWSNANARSNEAARQLERSFAAIAGALDRITVFAIAGVALSGASLLLLARVRKPDPVPAATALTPASAPDLSRPQPSPPSTP